MKRQIFARALTFGLAAAALVLTGCSTTENRISENPEAFNSLSSRDQELVKNGQIRVGMSQSAVYLAWGAPGQKAVGAMKGHETETWIYFQYTTGPYGYGYGGFGGGGIVRVHHHNRFFFYGDPFYDPFYYSYIPPTVSYPYKVVTFSGGRVVSFQSLIAPYHY